MSADISEYDLAEPHRHKDQTEQSQEIQPSEPFAEDKSRQTEDDVALAFPINVRATLAHMRQDMRDDWFFDTLKYDDLFSDPSHLAETIRENLALGHGLYQTGIKQIYDVPKSSYGLRYSLETDFYDRFIYQAICSYLIPFYDPLLSKRVLSHRFNNYRRQEKYIFKNRIDLWQTFEGITYLGIRDGGALLVTDLINYYEHISVEAIETAFIKLLPSVAASGPEKHKIRNAIQTLVTLLKKWCFNENHGLPQNRDTSSFIANVVLFTVDKEMELLGYDYYRYVDDIRIVCKNFPEARKSLSVLIKELRKLGMNINAKKTDILTNQNSPEKIAEFFPIQDDRSFAIDNMWKSKNKKVITRSIPVLLEMLVDILDKNETQSRQFRFCVNRFKSLISTNIFDTKSLLAQELAAKIIEHFVDQPVSTDQFCKLLAGLDLDETNLQKIEDFLTDDAIAIYQWQNYNLWLLLGHKKYKSEKLIAHALSRCMHHSLEGDVPACFIYLSSVDEQAKVEDLIPLFSESWPYQHQRFFLVSLQNSSPETLQPLLPKMTIQLKGTIKRIRARKSISGVFINDYDPTSFTDIYDELNPYD